VEEFHLPEAVQDHSARGVDHKLRNQAFNLEIVEMLNVPDKREQLPLNRPHIRPSYCLVF
jgi:hypothetical protein